MADEPLLGAEFARNLFRVNGQMLAAGEQLTRPVGLTVARWQVLGAVLRRPLNAAGIAREMGISRQAVQRVANRLIDDGLLQTLPNPAHNRSPLLSPTNEGVAAVQKIAPQQADFSVRLAEAFGYQRFRQLVDDLAAFSEMLDSVDPWPGPT
jgi:DNA-binding MarR family transcriptional regulator